MKAGREDATAIAEPRTDFGTDIPESDEEYQDDEYLVGVRLCKPPCISLLLSLDYR